MQEGRETKMPRMKTTGKQEGCLKDAANFDYASVQSQRAAAVHSQNRSTVWNGTYSFNKVLGPSKKNKNQNYRKYFSEFSPIKGKS